MLQVQTEALDTLPKMWVINPPPIRVERIDHLKEAALPTGCLGCGVQRRRARVLAGHRKVTEDDAGGTGANLGPSSRAMRTAEIGVNDQELTFPAHMVIGTKRRYCGAGEVGGQTPTEARPSKIRLAPGISSGVGDSCTHATVPPSSIRTSERLAWPNFSM